MKEKTTKDWVGGTNSSFKNIGATNHSPNEREKNDYYATEPKAVRLLLEIEKFEGTIWECACGEGHLSEEMIRLGYDVFSSDIIDRNYKNIHLKNEDFLSSRDENKRLLNWNIITNPPYKYANQFIEKALEIIEIGKKVAFFLPIRYLETKSRKVIFEKYPPIRVHVSSSRLKCAMNGDFEKMANSAVCYAWFVWQKGHTGTTELKLFN